MKFYQLLTFIILGILVFIPVQISPIINYIIYAFSIFLVPLFIKNAQEDLQAKNPITIFFLLFLATCAFSTIFSIDQARSLPTLMLYFSYFIVFTSIRSIFPNQKSKELVASCYLLTASLLSVISLYHTLILHYVNREAEGVSFMWIYYGHNHLSALLLFAIPLCFFFLKKFWHKKFLNVALFVIFYLLLFTLIFTFGFTSMVSLAISSIVTVFVFSTLHLSKKMVISLCIAGILGLFLLGTFWLPQKVGFRKTHAGSAVARTVYWKNAISNFVSNPILGTGLDTFRSVNKVDKKTLPSYYAFNFFLQMLTDAGILGFLTSIGLITSLLWQAFKRIHKQFFNLMLFISLVASTFNALVDFDWQLPTVFLIYWIIGSLLYAD